MKNATHRVVILKNCNSAFISQAIFFLKDSAPDSETKLLAEAEKIVEKYMSSGNLSGNLIADIKKPAEKNIIKFLSAGIFFLGIIGVIIALI